MKRQPLRRPPQAPTNWATIDPLIRPFLDDLAALIADSVNAEITARMLQKRPFTAHKTNVAK